MENKSTNMVKKLKDWINGESVPADEKFEVVHQPKSRNKKQKYIEVTDSIRKEAKKEAEQFANLHQKRFRILYRIISVIACISLLTILLVTVSCLPKVGDPANPENNEVSQRYIEQGLQETGAVNIVAGMILDYRAFDTFGESCVLFIASCCVFIMLRIGDNKLDQKRREREIERDRSYEPRFDIILRSITSLLVPVILIFGIYIVLNGHISPGGGFSGGAVIGAGLILYLSAFGFDETHRFLNEKTVKWMTFIALTFYCMAKSYSFFTGANHLESGIPLGTPGAILSSGLILPLNICVGIIVACTMYAFYSLFRKGAV